MEKARYIVLALSARFIAEAAHRDAYSALAVDGFADRDLQAIADDYVKVSLHNGSLDSAAVVTACRKLNAKYSSAGIVVGPGAENQTDVLKELSDELRLFGNNPEIIAFAGDRARTRELLHTLGIPTLDASAEQWADLPVLQKVSHTSGGAHIRWGGARTHGDIHEAYMPGIAVSHLFLADGDRAVSAGFNTQWSSRHDRMMPFCYGGAINRAPLDADQRRTLELYAQKLTEHLHLQGLNSIDYLLGDGGLYCLELNPRPSASMQINEKVLHYASGEVSYLFGAHLRACAGQLPISPVSFDEPPAAHAIIYADGDRSLPDEFEWSPACRDVPAQCRQFSSGQPACSVIVSDDTESRTLTRLQEQIRQVVKAFTETYSSVRKFA